MHCSFKVNLLQEQNIAATIARMEVASSRREIQRTAGRLFKKSVTVLLQKINQELRLISAI